MRTLGVVVVVVEGLDGVTLGVGDGFDTGFVVVVVVVRGVDVTTFGVDTTFGVVVVVVVRVVVVEDFEVGVTTTGCVLVDFGVTVFVARVGDDFDVFGAVVVLEGVVSTLFAPVDLVDGADFFFGAEADVPRPGGFFASAIAFGSEVPRVAGGVTCASFGAGCAGP